ncbi:MAG: 50S ribosomal protein L22 [Anaerolineae bacterium]
MAVITEARAITRFAAISPRKTRLVIDQVRGLQVEKALAVLKFLPNKPARVVYKTVASAMANAEENLGLSRSDLFVTEIRADEGPRRQWRRFGARGRFKPITRKTSHVTVVLTEKA